MKNVFASMILSLLMTAPALCETSIWIAKTDTSVMYIGGVIHILRESDRPFPPEFDKAYDASEILVLETDYDELESPRTQQTIMAKAVYADGRTIDSVISTEAYEKLDKLCTENGLSLATMNQYKPAMILTTLAMLELQKLGISQEGIDAYYHDKATADKKSLGMLETVEKQIEAITSLGEGNESAFVLYSVREMGKIEVLFDEMIKAWRTGSESALYDLLLLDLEQDFPKLFDVLFVERNVNWMPKIENYLITTQTEFVLVGAGHLLGKEGVIAQLKKTGYEVEKFK